MSSCAYLSKKLRLYSFPFIASYTSRIDRTSNGFARLVPCAFARSSTGPSSSRFKPLRLNVSYVRDGVNVSRSILLRASIAETADR